jgi:hypothetical protein
LISDGPYAGFAGRDASRGLATFSVEAITDEYDDLLDLKASEIEQVRTNLFYSVSHNFIAPSKELCNKMA